jgi:hypothetical protein
MWPQVIRVAAVGGLLFAANVITALTVTYVANATNVMGLGWLVLALWLLYAASAFVLARKYISIDLFLVGALVVAVLSYWAHALVGFYLLGWTGLLKE